jgi:hypothetical protein
VAGPAYNWGYQKARARVLSGQPVCVHCSRRPATEADHQPALRLHHHVDGSGCCVLLPSCGPCARRQGALLSGRLPATVKAAPAPLAPDDDGFGVDDPVWSVPWIAELGPPPPDATWPRLMTAPHPDAVGSLGGAVTAWVAEHTGVQFRWWQRLVNARLLEHDADGHLCWREAVVSTSRQVGKSVDLRGLVLWRIHAADRFGGVAQDVMHTGKDISVCKEVQRPARYWARGHNEQAKAAGLPEPYKVREVNGQEEIEHVADHSRWMIRAKGGAYGFTITLGVVDEAWKVPADEIDDGLIPTMVERDDAQVVLWSTAHRKATPLVLRRRLAAVADLYAADCLLVEWSAPADAELDDEQAWRAASPAWSTRRRDLIAARLTAARAGETEPDADEADPIESFRTQWLNQWPRKVARPRPGEPLLADGAWDACAGTLDLAATTPGWVGLEDNRDTAGGAAVAFAVNDGAGRYELDGLTCATWDAAVELARDFAVARPGSQLVVGASMGRQVPADFPRRSAMRHAVLGDAVRALALLRALVAERRIVHDSTAELDEQIADARVRVTAAGALSLVPHGRRDLLAAALWALWWAQTPPSNPAVH